MDLTHHFILMAKYNQRMNAQVINSIEPLSDKQLNEDRGAYFSSILGTLNHILVGDILWLGRFSRFSQSYKSLTYVGDIAKPQSLDVLIYPEFLAYKAARLEVDTLLLQWCRDELKVEDLASELCYSNSKGISSSRNFAELISHLFNHQTHHRGQVSTLLNQLNIDIGVTDFLIDIPETSLS